ASGRVLEIGIGSGLNLPLYGEDARQVLGLEPSARLLAMARQAARATRTPLALIEGSAEAIPLDDRSVDSVVTTWTMCSIADAGPAPAERRRVRSPGGPLLSAEPGPPPDARGRRGQARLTPA